MAMTNGIKCTSGVTLFYTLLIVLMEFRIIYCASTHHARAANQLPTPQLPAVVRARKHSCGEPQQRGYHLVDLMYNEGLLKNGEQPNQPAYLVVRRCDSHSGCCPSIYMTCRPDPETIYFERLEIELSYYDGRPFRMNITVEQHASCYCDDSINQTERETMDTQRPKIVVEHTKLGKNSK